MAYRFAFFLPLLPLWISSMMIAKKQLSRVHGTVSDTTLVFCLLVLFCFLSKGRKRLVPDDIVELPSTLGCSFLEFSLNEINKGTNLFQVLLFKFGTQNLKINLRKIAILVIFSSPVHKNGMLLCLFGSLISFSNIL